MFSSSRQESLFRSLMKAFSFIINNNHGTKTLSINNQKKKEKNKKKEKEKNQKKEKHQKKNRYMNVIYLTSKGEQLQKKKQRKQMIWKWICNSMKKTKC